MYDWNIVNNVGSAILSMKQLHDKLTKDKTSKNIMKFDLVLLADSFRVNIIS